MDANIGSLGLLTKKTTLAVRIQISASGLTKRHGNGTNYDDGRGKRRFRHSFVGRTADVAVWVDTIENGLVIFGEQ